MMSIKRLMIIVEVMALCLFVGFAQGAVGDYEVGPGGELVQLYGLGDSEMLDQAIGMRIVERELPYSAPQPTESEAGLVVDDVAATSGMVGTLDLYCIGRSELLVIESAQVTGQAERMDDGNYQFEKRSVGANLSWSGRYEAVAGGVKLTVTFRNLSDIRRSLDIEFPVALGAGDYEAHIPARNDYPEWEIGSRLAYGLRLYDGVHTEMSQPMFCVYSPERNVGLTIAAGYDYPILPFCIDAYRSAESSSILVTFPRVRLDGHSERTIELHIVTHEGDWRCGLNYARNTWPDKFWVDPEVCQRYFLMGFGLHGGTGHWYPDCALNSRHLQNSFSRNNPWGRMVWEVQGLSECYGVYIKDEPQWKAMMDETWWLITRHPEWFPAEFIADKPANDAGYEEVVAWLSSRPESMFDEVFRQGITWGWDSSAFCANRWHGISEDKMLTMGEAAADNGLELFLYWNPTTVWDLYAEYAYPETIVAKFTDMYGMNPAICTPARGTIFREALLDQVELAASSLTNWAGIMVDQGYGGGPISGFDDGWTIQDNGEVASMDNGAVAETIMQAKAILEHYGKHMLSNHMWETIDITCNADLGLSEDRQSPGASMETARYACIGNRPHVDIQNTFEIQKQVDLRNGSIDGISGIIDNNDYSTRYDDSDEGPWLDRLYVPLFDLLQQRSWCLEANCLTLPGGFEGNLFRIDDDDNLVASVVAYGETFGPQWTRFDVPLTVQVADAVEFKAAYIVGAANLGVFKIPFERDGNSITVSIPWMRGSVCVVFAKAGRFVSIDSTMPVVRRGSVAQFAIAVDNFTDTVWQWRGGSLVTGRSTWLWEDVPAGASISSSTNDISVASDYAAPFTQVIFAKDVPSRLPMSDGAGYLATFELFVEDDISAFLVPSRELVLRTLTNSDQGGYKPFNQAHPLYVYEGELAEFTLGISNNVATASDVEFRITAIGLNVTPAVSEAHLDGMSRVNVVLTVCSEQRGPAEVNVEILQDGAVVASCSRSIQVFGRSIRPAELAEVESVALVYDIWGSSAVYGDDVKRITLNGVLAGELVTSDGTPMWFNRVRCTLNAAAAMSVAVDNTLSIDNPATGFWKVRNMVLELQMADGSVVHLVDGDMGIVSSPVGHAWSEGTTLNCGQAASWEISSLQ